MARIITTISEGGTDTPSAITSADVISSVQKYAGYEYIKTITLSTSEVGSIDITGLDSSIYSNFLILSSRLGYGGGTSNVTWTLQILTGSSTVDTGSNYEYQGIKYSSATGTYASGQTSWSTTFGYGGPIAIADFNLQYNITPNTTYDANMTLQVTDSKFGGYWPSSGIMTGIHLYNGTTPTGIRISSSQNFRAITGTAYITVLGLRIKA